MSLGLTCANSLTHSQCRVCHLDKVINYMYNITEVIDFRHHNQNTSNRQIKPVVRAKF